VAECVIGRGYGRRMRRLVLPAAVLLLASCAGRSSPDPISPDVAATGAAQPVTLREVTDGDSLVVTLGDEDVEVRLLGINAPEIDECHGAAARDVLQALVSGADLSMQRGGDDHDQYGRLLRWLTAGDESVNAALVRDGHAIAIHTDHPLRDDFLALDDTAFEEGRGMWAPDACGPPPPAGVRFSDAEPNPPGDDAAEPEREWVEIGNESGTAVAMGGWVLRDESSQHRYTFPAGFTLPSGATVRVFSGCGEPAAGALWWCTGAVWSNGGDTAILQDEHGTVVDRTRLPARS
jgi:endonuclease YncB( thermonuclease family)